MARRLVMVALALGAIAGFGSAALHGVHGGWSGSDWRGHCEHHDEAAPQ